MGRWQGEDVGGAWLWSLGVRHRWQVRGLGRFAARGGRRRSGIGPAPGLLGVREGHLRGDHPAGVRRDGA